MASAGHTSVIKPDVPASIQIHHDPASSKRDLVAWWGRFKRSGKSPTDSGAGHRPAPGIFGVALQESIRYANVPISLLDENGESYIYGYVPIIVAMCGIFLKDKATEVEGIFRLAGSEKRIKELRAAFDSPDRYGKNLDWTGYTVHDAANILRRYFNQLPEPIIPLEFYERFRKPMKSSPQLQTAICAERVQGTSPVDANIKNASIKEYQTLIKQLSPMNRQLLLYILDLLAVFAAKAESNKMTNPNLAAIFQPGILSHPQHDLAPAEYLLSQNVLVFLIENQDSFLIGMHGTATDAKTVRDVQNASIKHPSVVVSSGNSSHNSLPRRSSSNASGGDNTRRWGGLRRNVSVSSREPLGITSPTMSQSRSGGGVHRSNTVPSRRPNGTVSRFGRGEGPESGSEAMRRSSALATPTEGRASIPDHRRMDSSSTNLVAPPVRPTAESASSSETVTPSASKFPSGGPAARVAKGSDEAKPLPRTPMAPASGHSFPESTEHSSPATSTSTPSSRHLLDILKKQPEGEKRARKLQKKRRDASSLSSAQSSQHDLSMSGEDTTESEYQPSRDDGTYALEHRETAVRMPPPPLPKSGPHRTGTDSTLRARSSSALSSQSRTTATDTDVDGDGDDAHAEKKAKRRWRFRGSSRAAEAPAPPVGATGHATTTIGPSGHDLSWAAETRESQGTTSTHGSGDKSNRSGATTASFSGDGAVMSDSEEKKKGPMTWIRTKLTERKDKEVKSPIRTTGGGESEKAAAGHADPLTDSTTAAAGAGVLQGPTQH